MFGPTSSSGTAWIAPPDSFAAPIAKSPSAGLPIASDRATVSAGAASPPVLRERGRDRCAAFRLAAVQPRRRPVDEADLAQLAEALVDLRDQRAGGDRGDDGVGQLPAELLGDLERERLRALGVVRAEADVDERPVELERELDGEPAAVVVRAVDGVDGRRRRRAVAVSFSGSRSAGQKTAASRPSAAARAATAFARFPVDEQASVGSRAPAPSRTRRRRRGP